MRQMDDVSHESHGSQIDVVGYRSCINGHCGQLVIAEVAERTRGLCIECHRDDLGRRLGATEVRVKARRIGLSGPRPNFSNTRGGDRWVHKQGEKARARARRRLVQLFPELYELLVAEERARAGLEPWPPERFRDQPGDTGATIDFAAVYHALDEHGVNLDGFEDQDAATT